MESIHFIGIGGIGMSGLAKIYLDRGFKVSGSDLNENKLIENLRKEGALISNGHSELNIPKNCALVVKSTCIKSDNPEILRCYELNIPVILRGELLEKTLQIYPDSFAVTGTHGKTTTSSLVAHIMETIGKDPTVLIGGEVDTFGGNAKSGKSSFLVAEVDESDGYFRKLSSKYAVITNIEREHMEHYDSMQDLKNSYGQFIDNIHDDGFLVVNGEDKTIKEVLFGRNLDVLTFGINGDFNISCKNYTSNRMIEFDLLINGVLSGRIKSSMIGEYNIMNILAAVALTYKAVGDLSSVIKAIGTFNGVKRRFDRVGKIGSIEIIEDYAHHPTEIKAVIKAAEKYTSGRVLTIFQPHRYSRTLDLKYEFKDCFSGSTLLILTDIYSAHEDNVKSFSLKELFCEIGVQGVGMMHFMEKEKVADFIATVVKEGDIILILGAGDIRNISASVVYSIKKTQRIKQ